MDVLLHGRSVLKDLRPRKALALSLFAFTACFLTGCGFPVQYSPDYKSKLAMAQKDCKGDEIVGIWQAKVKGNGLMSRETLLFTPNGTGRIRQNVGTGPFYIEANWQYAGGGVWNATGHYVPPSSTTHTYAIHYANGELLVQYTAVLTTMTEVECAVFERVP